MKLPRKSYSINYKLTVLAYARQSSLAATAVRSALTFFLFYPCCHVGNRMTAAFCPFLINVVGVWVVGA